MILKCNCFQLGRHYMEEHTRIWEGHNVTCLGWGSPSVSQCLEFEVWALNFYTRELSLIFIWTLKINPCWLQLNFALFLFFFVTKDITCYWTFLILLMTNISSLVMNPQRPSLPSLNVLSEHLIKGIAPLSNKSLQSNFPLMSGIYMQEAGLV